MTVRDSGRDAVMINCNPETVSTDYDTSDRLYFEPLTAEDVLAVIEIERPEGVIVQFGGQTPLRLAPDARGGRREPARHARSTRSTWPRTGAASVRCCGRLEIAHPPYGTALSAEEALVIAEAASASRCSSAPPTCSAAGRWRSVTRARTSPPTSSQRQGRPGAPAAARPLPRGRDRGRRRRALRRRASARLAGVMQHVEEAGVHSGDSACVIPPMSLGEEMLDGSTRRPGGSRSSSA